MASRHEQILLGIDTGGTYTDAVIFSHAQGVISKAKSLTTKHDLSVGISKAADLAIDRYDGDPAELAFASISTTLATNALVEGKGNSVALIMIGFEPSDLDKAGLSDALGSDPVLFLPGGHDVHGNGKPLDVEPLAGFVEANRDSINAFAIVGMFAVRNASHEITVRDCLIDITGLPCTCSHELSLKLGGPKRALTTLLNARLVPMIRHLIEATRGYLATTGLDMPLMIVRGDGTMVGADFALTRPIETILSGPAASLVGVKQLVGASNAVVSDIGGTTTDIAILEEGWPRIDPGGAIVGGFHTMVEAVAMHTYGLGGDSEVSLDERSATGLKLGPRRQVPISLLALEHDRIVLEELRRQARLENITHLNGRFAFLSAVGVAPGMLRTTEAKLLEKLADFPKPLDLLLRGNSELGTLNSLVKKGLVHVGGFTPSDACHVLDLQHNWNLEAAQIAAELFARQRNRFGNRIADGAMAISARVKNQLTRQSADFILETCMREDGLELGTAEKKLIERSLDNEKSFAKLDISLDRALIGVGASAKIYYPAVGERLNSQCLVPGDGDVANAIGAVSGMIRIKRSLTLISDDGGGSFQLMNANQPERFTEETAAFARSRELVEEEVACLMKQAGAEETTFETTFKTKEAQLEGKRHLLEVVFVSVGTGMPRIC